MDLLQGEQPEIWAQCDPPPVELSIGDIWSQIAAEWLQIAQTAQRSQWRAYRKPPSLFRMVPSLTPYNLSFPQNGSSICPAIYEWPYLCNGWSNTLHVWFYRVGFSGSADRVALFPVTSNPSWRQAAILDNFEWPYLRNDSFERASRGHLCDSTAFLFLLAMAVRIVWLRINKCEEMT